MRIEGCNRDVILVDAIALNDEVKSFKTAKDNRNLSVLYAVYAKVSPSCIHHARARYQKYMGVYKPGEYINENYGYVETYMYECIINGFGFEDKFRVPEEVETVVEDDMALVDEPKTTIDYTEQIADIHDAVIEVADDLAETLAEIDKKKSDELRELTLSVNRLGNCMMQMLDYLKEIKDKVVTE